jgi:hypothetical protein
MTTKEDTNACMCSNTIQSTDPDFVILKDKIDRWLKYARDHDGMMSESYVFFANCDNLLDLVNDRRRKFQDVLHADVGFDFSALRVNPDPFLDGTGDRSGLLQLCDGLDIVDTVRCYNFIGNNKKGIHTLEYNADFIDEIRVISTKPVQKISLFFKERLCMYRNMNHPGDREIYWPLCEVSGNVMRFQPPLPAHNNQEWCLKIVASEHAQIRITTGYLDTTYRRKYINRKAIQHIFSNKL